MFVLLGSAMHAQGFSDDFSDGNFSNAPTWLGDASKFIVNPVNELQLDDQSAGSSNSAYLVTNSIVIDSASWEFYLRLDFAPSTSNFAKVYLVSNQQDLTNSLNGYFVKIGGISGTSDDISLYRQDGNLEIEIIDGRDGLAGFDPVEMRVKVTKNQSGLWELFTDTSNAQNNYFSEGTVTDITYGQSNYFGVYCRYSSTRSDKFAFDDIIVSGKAFQDTIKPTLDKLTINNQNSLILSFTEKVEPATALNPSNYFVNKGVGAPTTVSYLGADSSKLNLNFNNGFINGESHQITVQGIGDFDGNIMDKDSLSFFYFQPVPGVFRDITINELMPDPTPSQGLPNLEYIELFNASNKVFDLNNWTISDASSSATLTGQLLKPNEHLILTKISDTSSFSSFGNVLGVSGLPSLNNGGDELILKDDNGLIIDQIQYNLDWYKDPLKENGGFSLEQINPYTVCYGEQNFTASTDLVGGTPGLQNSVFDTIADIIPPSLVSAVNFGADSVLLTFSEFMDTVKLKQIANYVFNTNTLVSQAQIQSPQYSSVLLLLSNPLDSGIINTLTINNLSDCSGNPQASAFLAEFIISARPTYRDLVINEVLADPVPSQGLPEREFIELYNASNKIFDLNRWQIGDASSDVALTSFILKPNEYVILCSSSDVGAFNSFGPTLGVNRFPSLNNSDETVRLRYSDNTIVDQIRYDEEWYKDFNKEDGGFTLEQINPFSACYGQQNFRASDALNGGTPGVQNSVFDTLPDLTSPNLVESFTISSDSVLLSFDEFMDSVSISNASNYSFSTAASISQAKAIAPDYTDVLLIFNTPLDSGIINVLTVNNVKDCPGNSISSPISIELVIPSTPEFRDVVINELMPDPTPSVGLPEAEFIEIYNASDKIFELKDWTIGDNSIQSILSARLFKPGEFLIICARESEQAFSSFGPTQGQNQFPSLGNSGDKIQLMDSRGLLIDQIEYDPSWYTDPNKSSGGYTLEQLRPQNSCTGFFNFSSPRSITGGTPGQINSVNDTTEDLSGPELIKINVITNDSLVLFFDKGLSFSSVDPNSFSFTDNNIVLNLNQVEQSRLSLKLFTAIDTAVVLQLNIDSLKDCNDNLSTDLTFDFVLPQLADFNDLVINEILFNPKSGGSDFIELYNKSDKILSLENWEIANFEDDSISNKRKIIEEPFLLFPSDYIVLTTNKAYVGNAYPNAVNENILEINSLPSFNDDEGRAILLDNDKQLIDDLIYTDNLHFPLLADDEGVTLERVDPNRSTNAQGNFQSAAESEGFGTPGYINSQFFSGQRFEGDFTVEPEIFSPDNDGIQDVVNFNYVMPSAGFVGTITIYDKQGRLIRTLVNNELLANRGSFIWNGLNDEDQKARIGVYLVVFEIFDKEGNQETYKSPCVVGGRL